MLQPYRLLLQVCAAKRQRHVATGVSLWYSEIKKHVSRECGDRKRLMSIAAIILDYIFPQARACGYMPLPLRGT
jgi:hypothetical protein